MSTLLDGGAAGRRFPARVAPHWPHCLTPRRLAVFRIPRPRGRAMFIEEYLVELRRERFALPALVRYAHRVGQRVRADWLANPNAVRSVWAVGIVYFAVAFLACVGMALAWDRELAERF